MKASCLTVISRVSVSLESRRSLMAALHLHEAKAGSIHFCGIDKLLAHVSLVESLINHSTGGSSIQKWWIFSHLMAFWIVHVFERLVFSTIRLRHHSSLHSSTHGSYHIGIVYGVIVFADAIVRSRLGNLRFRVVTVLHKLSSNI